MDQRKLLVKLVIFGLTITSSWGNGHATTYRSLCKAFARRGHTVHFIEKDAEWYRNHRDLPDPDFCTVHLYEEWNADTCLKLSRDADAIIIGSYFPDAIAATQALLQAGKNSLLFYDIDTPVTLAQLRLHGMAGYLDPALIPHYDAYLSFTGGPALHTLENDFGSPRAIGFYCSVDPAVYQPVTVSEHYHCDLSYLGTYAPDRQEKLMQLLNCPAERLPRSSFLVAGPQYPLDSAWQANVRRLDHVAPPQHPALYSSSRFTLNLTRHDMVIAGFSPSVRLFEASACGAAILSDTWEGLDHFLTPGTEILLPGDAYEVEAILRDMPEHEAKQIGRAARERILAQHTSAHRALQLETIVSSLPNQARLNVARS